MPHLSSLPPDAGVRHILALNPSVGRPLIELHEALLRQDTQLTAKHKELIAAYVSALNSCQYCYGVHAQTAKDFGVSADSLQALVDGLMPADIDPKLEPILRLARQLTLEPAKTRQAHVTAALEAGWSERDIHDAVMTTALFNFMNRVLDGHGVTGNPLLHAQRGTALKTAGYAPLLEFLAASAP